MINGYLIASGNHISGKFVICSRLSFILLYESEVALCALMHIVCSYGLNVCPSDD